MAEENERIFNLGQLISFYTEEKKRAEKHIEDYQEACKRGAYDTAEKTELFVRELTGIKESGGDISVKNHCLPERNPHFYRPVRDDEVLAAIEKWHRENPKPSLPVSGKLACAESPKPKGP